MLGLDLIIDILVNYKSKKLIDKKQLGKIMFAKGSYGHGARLNYDKEWRMLPKMSGGGD